MGDPNHDDLALLIIDHIEHSVRATSGAHESTQLTLERLANTSWVASKLTESKFNNCVRDFGTESLEIFAGARHKDDLIAHGLLLSAARKL
jgi:hypothetical protein